MTSARLLVTAWPLPPIEVIHDDGLLEQARIHLAAEQTLVDLLAADLFADLVINRYAQHWHTPATSGSWLSAR